MGSICRFIDEFVYNYSTKKVILLEEIKYPAKCMFCGDIAKLIAFCDVLYNFRVKYLCSVRLRKSDLFMDALFMLFIFIYVQHISTSDDDHAFSSNTTDVVSETVAACPSTSLKFAHVVRDDRHVLSLVISVVLVRPLLVFLNPFRWDTTLSVLLFMAFGTFA